MVRFRAVALDVFADFVALAVVTICVWSVFVWVSVLSTDWKLYVAAGVVLVRYFLREILPSVKMKWSSWRERAADDDNGLEV